MSALNHLSPMSSAHRLVAAQFLLLASALAATSCGDEAGLDPADTLSTWSLSEEPTLVIGGATSARTTSFTKSSEWRALGTAASSSRTKAVWN